MVKENNNLYTYVTIWFQNVCLLIYYWYQQDLLMTGYKIVLLT